MIANDSSDAVEAREQTSSSLIAHIQSATELEKALLARELHDELGGLLVGAVMDLAWAEQHMNAPPAELKQKLLRARLTLAAAIDLKRKLIEDLRPTLLDNVGLFAALRWHVQATCDRAGFTCSIQLPDDERRFHPNIPIALFRIVQGAFAVVMAQRPPGTANFSVSVERQWLMIEIASDRPHSPPVSETEIEHETHLLAAIQQRTAALGGQFKHVYHPAGGTSITAQFPAANMLLAA